MSRLKLLEYLSANLNESAENILPLLQTCEVKKLERNEFLLQQNEFCKYTFFVEKGLLRQYSIDQNGTEHTISFAPENWFVTDRESVYFDLPSKYYIQALEESVVVLIDEDFIQMLSRKIPSFKAFNDKLLHNHIRHLQERINLLLSANAKKRYLHFVKMYPDILVRVPQTMVASYLGITPEGLSRVRKNLASKTSVNRH